MFQFSCRFAFLSSFRVSNRTPKITRIVTLYQANAATLMPFSEAVWSFEYFCQISFNVPGAISCRCSIVTQSVSSAIFEIMGP